MESIINRIALIPAYQPDETLVTLAQELAAKGFYVVIIDDGSGTEYSAVFNAASRHAAVLTHTVNRGKGCALKTGLGFIAQHAGPDTVAVTLDSDGQHSVADTVRVWEEADLSRGTLVLGSRRFGGGVPPRSRFGNAATRLVFALSTGKRVYDTQTGLRAFSSQLFPLMLEIEGERYEYEMNVLMKCARSRIPIREIGIETIYHDNNSGSHFDTLKDSLRIYSNILKFAASSAVGFAVDYIAYCLLILATGGLGTAISVPLSNVTARVISAAVNFGINKRFVFKSRASLLYTGVQYFILAACILAGNTVLLSFMVQSLHVNRFAGKLVTEVTFFTLSWLAQRFVIFRGKKA